MTTLDTRAIDETTIANNDEITAKANSLRDQLRPFIEERSLKKLQKNSKMVELTNLKFKLAQKYLDLKNRTNITINYLIDKLNNRSKFLDNKLQNSFAFKRNKTGYALNGSLTQPTISPALLQNNNTFKINSKIISAISKDNLDNLETKLNENELLIKQINDYRSKLTQINEILEEMELVNQEVIIEEDQETVKKDELMNKLENDQNMKLEEIHMKKEKIENDLNQCLELYKTLKMKLNAVLHQKNSLKAKVNEQKRLFADVSMKLKSLVENNRKEMNEFQRKIIERRERDLAIIKAFRIRKIELTKYLEEKEKLVKKNLNISENSFKTTIDELEKGDGEKNFNDDNLNKNEIEDADDAAYIDYNLIEEFNPEANVKNKYFKELSNNYRISRRDTIWKINLGDATHLLDNEKRLEDVEGIVFVDEEFNYPTDSKFEIGDGYFSTLYQGKSIMYKTNDKKLIIKKFNFNKINSSIEKEILNNGFKVCAYLSKYPNKNIIEILDLYEIRNEQTSKIDYYLIEEYCLSNLDQFLCDFKNELCISDIKTIADGLANALFYLHNNGIAHQNICTLSIQINERKLIKLGYIECSVICYSAKENCFKTKTISEKQILDKRFAAPEILGKSKYCPIKADIYSYGLILAYCYRRKPFNKLNDNQTIANRKEIEICELATSLIENCLIKNPNNRYSINNIITHCYFN